MKQLRKATRRGRLVSLALALVLAGLLAGLPGGGASAAEPGSGEAVLLAPWSMRGRDAQHTARSPFVGPQTAALKWAFAIGYSTVNLGLPSAPVVDAGGTIYIAGVDAFYAVNPDGTLKWRYQPEGSVASSSPALGADGTVYIGTSAAGTYSHGFLDALRPDGTVKWRYPTIGTPLVPTIAGSQTIYFASGGYLYALRPDGTPRWRKLTRTDGDNPPALARDGTIYVGKPGGCIDEPLICVKGFLLAFRPDGTPKWRYSVGYSAVSSAAVDRDGTVYIKTDGRESYLTALTPDGALKWRYPAEGIANLPAIGSDGTVYFGDGASLTALRPDGTLRWSYSTGGGVFSSPAIGADGTVYFGSDDKQFYALGADGTLKWSYWIRQGATLSSPAIGADGTVYVGTDVARGARAYLYAFGPGPAAGSAGD